MERETSPPSPSPQPSLHRRLRRLAHRAVCNAKPWMKRVDGNEKQIGWMVPVRDIERLYYVLRRMEDEDGQFMPECRGLPR